MRVSCDVLVAGAGPAGSSAARAAVKAGAKVFVADRRPVVGVPVQCAEYIPAQLVGELGLGRFYVVQDIVGMRTILPDGTEHVTKAPGCVIRRDQFDQRLAVAARQEGAQVVLCTRVLERLDDGAVLLRKDDGSDIEVEAKVVVGADGPRSTVGSWVGSVNEHLLVGVQASLELCRPLDHTEIYFDASIHAGYGWLFPKGETANVGLGLWRDRSAGEPPAVLIERFVQRMRDLGKVRGLALSHSGGLIPAERPRRAVHGDVILVGDAAGQTHPITGAGIFAAVTCGEMAGRWAAEAALAGDVGILEHYEDEWRALFGDTLERASQRRDLMEGRWSELDDIIRSCWVAFKEYYAAVL